MSQLVPGDLVLLSAGDLIPADGRVVEASDFFVNQALLTGEPYPVEKHTSAVEDPQQDAAHAPNLVCMGTSVVSGSARVHDARARPWASASMGGKERPMNRKSFARFDPVGRRRFLSGLVAIVACAFVSLSTGARAQMLSDAPFSDPQTLFFCPWQDPLLASDLGGTPECDAGFGMPAASSADTATRGDDPAIEEPAEEQAEAWNWHAQNTDTMQGYPAIRAKYTGPNSLPPGGQIRQTVALDLYAGVRLWPGAEAHLDLLMWQGFGLHDTLGIDAFPNGEAYKAGTGYPRFSIARLFIRQTIGLGGEPEDVPDDQLTLAGKRDISRLTITLGRLAVIDIFDNNAYAGDPSTQFMNWAFVTNVAWDYPADALGYTTGLAIELNQPKWALRYGFFQISRLRNLWTAEDQIFVWPVPPGAGGGEFFSTWGMVTEFERRYSLNAHPGAIRFLAYLNEIDMGTYHAALSVPGADIDQTRADRYAYGFGLNWQQEITKNAGVFSRLGWNEGHTEAWNFTDINYTGSLGISVKGEAWRRPDDTFGLAGVISGITRDNQKFLQAGGTGILDGDGALDYGPETILETYYDCMIWKNIHLAADYQFVANPAFNRDRGPVSVLAMRLHAEL